jgi:hypothetical protein
MSVNEQDNFIYLTAALVVLLFGTAVADLLESRLVQRLIQSGTTVTLIATVWGIRTRTTWHKSAIGLTGGIALVMLIGLVADMVAFDWLSIALLLVFFVLSASMTARQILFTGPIDGNKLVGAVALYLLLGLIWAMLYVIIDEINPGTFNGIEPGHWTRNLADFTYFSFVALSTLGFGDISPTYPVARFLVYMEALIGQFYLAILVASLVGTRLSSKQVDTATQRNEESH